MMKRIVAKNSPLWAAFKDHEPGEFRFAYDPVTGIGAPVWYRRTYGTTGTA